MKLWKNFKNAFLWRGKLKTRPKSHKTIQQYFDFTHRHSKNIYALPPTSLYCRWKAFNAYSGLSSHFQKNMSNAQEILYSESINVEEMSWFPPMLSNKYNLLWVMWKMWQQFSPTRYNEGNLLRTKWIFQGANYSLFQCGDWGCKLVAREWNASMRLISPLSHFTLGLFIVLLLSLADPFLTLSTTATGDFRVTHCPSRLSIDLIRFDLVLNPMKLN